MTTSRWPTDRAEELNQLRELLATVAGLNNSSGFIEAVRWCIGMADHLRRNTMGGSRPSFIEYLRRDCIEERTASRGICLTDEAYQREAGSEARHE